MISNSKQYGKKSKFFNKNDTGKIQNMENMVAIETSTSVAKTSVISIVFTQIVEAFAFTILKVVNGLSP